MIPSPADLTYFLEVANQLNLSRAAQNLNISQPSLTLAMQRLEQSLGTSLIIRHKRGVLLTKAGKQLLAHARQLLQQWDNIQAEAKAHTHEVQGSFVIGCHASVGLYSLPNFLPELLEQYPKLDITLTHDISCKITQQVIQLSVDIGIVVNPIKHPDVIIKKLDNDRISLWRGPQNKRIQDMHSGDARIICDPMLHQTQVILKNMKKQGMSYAYLIPTNSLEVAAELTRTGCGVGILPAKVAATKHLQPIPQSPFHSDEICLLYRGENRNIKAVQVITEAIKNAFKKTQTR